jgi:hypothetical protein
LIGQATVFKVFYIKNFESSAILEFNFELKSKYHLN